MVTDTQGLWVRLEKLERTNRRMRRVGLVLLALVVLVSCGMEATHSRTVEAEQFVLKDSNGRTRGIMEVTAEGPSFKFYDANQKVRLALSVFHDMPGLALFGSKEKNAAVLAVVPTGADLKGPETAGLMLYDLQGNARAQLDSGVEGPRLYLEDEKGFSATVGSDYSPVYPGRKRIAASVILSQKDLGDIWHAP